MDKVEGFTQKLQGNEEKSICSKQTRMKLQFLLVAHTWCWDEHTWMHTDTHTHTHENTAVYSRNKNKMADHTTPKEKLNQFKSNLRTQIAVMKTSGIQGSERVGGGRISYTDQMPGGYAEPTGGRHRRQLALAGSRPLNSPAPEARGYCAVDRYGVVQHSLEIASHVYRCWVM